MKLGRNSVLQDMQTTNSNNDTQQLTLIKPNSEQEEQGKDHGALEADVTAPAHNTEKGGALDSDFSLSSSERMF